MKLSHLFSIVIVITLLYFVLASCVFAKLPAGFPYRVLRPISDQSQIPKLSDEESYYKPPMDKGSVQMITKLASSTPGEKKLLQPQFREFMADRAKARSEKILNDTLIAQNGKPDFHAFWTDWYYATPEQQALLLIKFRDLLKSTHQESKIFSLIDDGCGAAINQGRSFGCGTYMRGQLEFIFKLAGSLKNQKEFVLAEEVYRTILDQNSPQFCSDIIANALAGYKNLLVTSGHSTEAA